MRSLVLASSPLVAAITLGSLALVPSAHADVVLDWNQHALNAVVAGGSPPPRASRALAMVQSAVFDAVNSVDRVYQPYLVNTVAPAGTSREAAAVVAAHGVLVGLYPAQAAALDAHRDASLAAIPDGPGKVSGIGLGQNVASAMIAWRNSDGSDAPSTYTPTDAPGHWRVGPGNVTPALLPQWGQVTPFAIASGAQFRPPAPPSLDSVEYANSLNQVKALGRATGSTRTPEQTDIALAWAFGAGTVTPPGAWNQIAQQLAFSGPDSVLENARLFAALNVATADAAIACWDAKYVYDLWRPVHAIRDAHLDGNALTDQEADWTPLLATPPFPAYTSGHSTFSRAAASVLAAILGSDSIDIMFQGDAGVIRHLTSLDAAADEAGLSRIYGGIHFDFDNIMGQLCGEQVADWVLANYFQIPAPGAGALLIGCIALAARRRR
ncbi:MAG: vanadium-dependent haloperoxidase [Phycisphaeraceae bacterium]|nr:vanadium-dependent haloperoxidase [Phycisphaeraceae bacterium]